DQEGIGVLHLETAPPDSHPPRRDDRPRAPQPQPHVCRSARAAPATPIRAGRLWAVRSRAEFSSGRRSLGHPGEYAGVFGRCRLGPSPGHALPGKIREDDRLLAQSARPAGPHQQSCRTHEPSVTLLGKGPLQVAASSDDRTLRGAGSRPLAGEETQERGGAANYYAQTIGTQYISQLSENCWMNLSRL